MLTEIEIDDDLIAAVLRETDFATIEAAVDAGLKLLLRLQRQKEILEFAGKIRWESDLDET
jgi:Arc/MetJ family transcription regulator